MESMRYMIRRAGPEHLSGVVACLAAAFEPHRPAYTPGAFNDTVPTLQGISDRLQHMTILCACDATGQVIGTVACSTTNAGEGHLRGMAVLPAFQGRGVAEGLLGAAEAELREHDCARVTLDTTRPLERAMRFYTRHGYSHNGIVTDFHGMPLYEYEKHL